MFGMSTNVIIGLSWLHGEAIPEVISGRTCQVYS